MIVSVGDQAASVTSGQADGEGDAEGLGERETDAEIDGLGDSEALGEGLVDALGEGDEDGL